jgi:hypothetical protein
MAENVRRRRYRPVGIGGPLILIGLGVAFLLNNLGIWEISVWELIFRFWPILLIAAGLDIFLGHRSRLGSLVALILMLAILAGAVWLSISGIRPELAGESISYPLGEATQAKVAIAPAVGDLRVEPLSDSSSLIEGTISGGWAEPDLSVVGKTANFVLESGEMSIGPFVDSWAWELKLTPNAPIDLDVDLAMGQADIDLSRLDISSLDVHMAMGRIEVALPDKGSFGAKVEGAIGEIVVVIPEGMAAKIAFDTGLAARQIPDSYGCAESVCTSANYTGADNKVDLTVNLAIGSVVVR